MATMTEVYGISYKSSDAERLERQLCNQFKDIFVQSGSNGAVPSLAVISEKHSINVRMSFFLVKDFCTTTKLEMCKKVLGMFNSIDINTFRSIILIGETSITIQRGDHSNVPLKDQLSKSLETALLDPTISTISFEFTHYFPSKDDSYNMVYTDDTCTLTTSASEPIGVLSTDNTIDGKEV